MEIKTTNDFSFFIDPSDLELVSQYKWRAMKTRHTMYVICDLRKTRKKVGPIVLLHRLLTQCPEGLVVDHIDGNGLNNRRANLRICEHYQNVSSTSRRNVLKKDSQYRGVHLCKSTNKWRAVLRDKGRTIYLGRFTSEEAAARCWDEEAKKRKGEFAYQNFKK